MLDLQAEVRELWSDLQPAIERVLRSGHFIGGSEVDAFEEEVAAYLGVRHAVGLNSGTDALVLGLEALGIGPGDEVLTTPFSFFATSEAILRMGATPVFGDIDPRRNVTPWVDDRDGGSSVSQARKAGGRAVRIIDRGPEPGEIFDRKDQRDRDLEIGE